MKKVLVCIALLVSAAFAFAQDALIGSWNGKLSIGSSSLTIVLNFQKDDSGVLSCTLDSPDQGAKDIKAQVVSATDLLVEITVPAIGAGYKGVLFNGALQGTFSQNGVDFSLNLQRGVPEVRRPQTPQPPFPYTCEDVSFTNGRDGAVLSGTLTVPENAGNGTPVLIMVTGSGLQNRDEEIFDHKPFALIADRLARAGVATLRYDDRGCGKSKGGDIAGATTENFLQDALAGIESLRKDGRFKTVGVLGHSEGADIAIMLAGRGTVDLAVCLAGTGVVGAEALAAQVNKLMELAGQDDRVTPEQYRAQVIALNNPWIAWFVDYDPTADIKAVRCPVFAVNGDRDVQVLSSVNLTAIREKLPDNQDNFIKEYPGLNHLFQHCVTGSPDEYRSIEETMSEELLSDMVIWLGRFIGK